MQLLQKLGVLALVICQLIDLSLTEPRVVCYYTNWSVYRPVSSSAMRLRMTSVEVFLRWEKNFFMTSFLDIFIQYFWTSYDVIFKFTANFKMWICTAFWSCLTTAEISKIFLKFKLNAKFFFMAWSFLESHLILSSIAVFIQFSERIKIIQIYLQTLIHCFN